MRKKKENKKGAGKPAFFSKPMKRINVMLDEDTVKFYTEQGKGNLSEGIRQYWRGLTQRAADLRQHCGHHAKYLYRLGNGKLICGYCGANR